MLSFEIPPQTSAIESLNINGYTGVSGKANMSKKYAKLQIDLANAKTLLDEPYKNPIAGKLMGFFEPFKHAKRQFAKEYKTFNINNAWLKIIEIYNYYPEIWNVTGVESKAKTKEARYFDNAAFPGSFIIATHHYVSGLRPPRKLIWNASSLVDPIDINKKPLADMYGLYEAYPKKWTMTKDNNGDVTDVKNIKHTLKYIKKPVQVYTSDLGFGVSEDYNKQEELHMLANFGQIISGLYLLQDGGNLITKQYTYFHPSTIAMIALLSGLFKKFYICKPHTSKEDNSEIYLVGLGLDKKTYGAIKDKLFDLLESRDVTKPILKSKKYTPAFKAMIEESANQIYTRQIKKIEYNVFLFNKIIEKTGNNISQASKLALKILDRYIRSEVEKWKQANPIRPLTVPHLKMRNTYYQ